MLSAAKQVIIAVALAKSPPKGITSRPATRGPKLVITRPDPLQNDTAVARTCVGKQFGQIDRMSREYPEDEEAEDRQHHRIKIVAVHTEEEVKSRSDGAQIVQHDGGSPANPIGDKAEDCVAHDAADAPERHAIADQSRGGGTIDAHLPNI